MSSYRSGSRGWFGEGLGTGSKIVILIFLLLMLGSGLGFLGRMLSRPAAVVDRVTNPDAIINNYEWFEEAYNDCLALDDKIRTTMQQIDSQFEGLPADRTAWSRQDREAYSQWNVTLNGQRSQRQNIVAEYNKRSNLITRNLWKAPHLPYQLEVVDDQTKGIE